MGGIKRFFGSRIVIVFLAVVVFEILSIYLIQIGTLDFIFNKNSLNSPKHKEIVGTVFTDLSKIQSSGSSWVEAKINWQDLEPGLDKYDWSAVDRVIQNSGNRAILLNIGIKHERLTLCSDGAKTECPPRNEQEFINFISTLFEHTKGKIFFFQIGDQLDKNNWQEDWKNYLSLTKKIEKIRGERIILSSNIPLSTWQDYEKLLVSDNGFQIIKVSADKSSAEVADNIVKFKKALKEKANSLPVWGNIVHSDVVLAQKENLNIEAVKKGLLLLANKVEKVFYPREAIEKVDNIVLFSKIKKLNLVDFGSEKIKTYELVSEKYSKPIYFLWAQSGDLNVTLEIDPAYYNFYDFKGEKVELNGKKIRSSESGLLMLPI